MPKKVNWKDKKRQWMLTLHERRRNKRYALQALNTNGEISAQAISSSKDADGRIIHCYEESNEAISMSNPLDEKENTNVAPDADRAHIDTGNRNAGIFEEESRPLKDHHDMSYNEDDAEDIKLEISAEPITTPKKTITGRRIVDINYFVKQLLEIASHGPMNCTSQELELHGEKQKGLTSTFTFRCKMCNCKFYVNSDCCDENFVNLNCCAVAGTVAIGCGQAQLEEFSSCLNIPTISERLYDKNHDLVSKHWEKVARENMKLAAEKEKEIAKEEGRVNKDGLPIIDVIADGCWSKRSFKKNYSAASGAAAIIGRNTGQILYLGVKNKYCQTCATAENKESESKEHVCYKNYKGSSTGMESQILVEGFKSSIKQHGLIYGKLISDGDSSTYSKILESRPYPDITVEKVECRNHVLRNFCNKLQGLITDTKYPIKYRKLINKKVILTMRCVIVKSIKKNKVGSDVQCLFEDILSSHLHAFGDHSKCKSYFCNRDGVDEATPRDFFFSSLWQRICSLVQSVAGHSRSLFQDVDSNAVENFHSVVAKLVGGKRVNFSKKASYRTRCFAAAVGFNTRKTVSSLYTSLNSGKRPQGKIKKLERSRIRKALLNQNNKRPKKKFFTRENKNGQNDCDYGEHCLKPDMADEQFEELKRKHLENLKKTDAQRNAIQEKTLLQSKSSEWMEMRRSLLTASNFGKIIKMRPDTSCSNTVKQLLYKADISQVLSIKHGRENERTAIKQLAKQLGIKIKSCGLFIDKYLPYLGATPDGVYSDDTVVEIKCPLTAHDIGIEEAIKQKKVTFWKPNKSDVLEINKAHDWFYQVQGQLHIAQRTKCIFAAWSNEHEPLKVEFILKDDVFWQNKMEAKLTTFYMTCILPELVDPRHPRNMPIRDPPPIQEAIKRKEEKRKLNKQPDR